MVQLDQVQKPPGKRGNLTTNQTLAALCAQLNLVLRGWTTYFRHSVAKATFNYLCSYGWRRVICWLRHKHPRASWKQLRRRYLPAWWPTEGRVRLANPAEVPVTRYRYRGTRIPTPWTSTTQAPARPLQAPLLGCGIRHHPGLTPHRGREDRSLLVPAARR